MFDIQKIKWREIGLILLIILLAIIFRIRAYQDGLSIGTSDTISYIQSANIPFFSREFFTAQRPFPLSLVYKLLQPSSGYELTLINKAWIGTDLNREMQPGLNRITITQSLFSIFSWCLLAWVSAFYIKNIYIKVISVLLTLSFAFSPQLADWDGVLMSESFSFSFFALVLALTILLSHQLWKNDEKKSAFTKGLVIIWMLALTLWIFIRDSNAYVILITLLMILMGLLLKPVRKKISIKGTILTLSLLFGIYLFHGFLFENSVRWVNPLFNNLLKNILPVPEHVEFMQKQGMPVTDEMNALMDSPGNEVGFFEIDELVDWVIQDGYSAYTRFLIMHPVWTVEKLYNNLEMIFRSNRQPYFRGTPESTPLWMLPIGDKLHVCSSWIILYDLILTVMIAIGSIRHKERQELAWTSIFIWLFLCELVLLFVSYHGDSLGIERHTLAAVMPFRFSVWLLTCVLCDILIQKRKDI